MWVRWGRPTCWPSFPEGGAELQQFFPVLGLSGAEGHQTRQIEYIARQTGVDLREVAA